MRTNLMFLAAAAALCTGATAQTPDVKVSALNQKRDVAVSVKGAKPSAIQLSIDGAAVAFQVADSGTSIFPLSSVPLAPGVHEVSVQLFDQEGRLLSETSQLVELEADPLAPIMVQWPRFNATVSGLVEVRIQAKGNKPFVSLFVDKEFRTLRNYSPYSFAWDTTLETNGWHLIEAKLYDDGLGTLMSPPVRVYVNNVGGRTDRRSEATTSVHDANEAMAESRPIARPIKPSELMVNATPDIASGLFSAPLNAAMASSALRNGKGFEAVPNSGQRAFVPEFAPVAPRTVLPALATMAEPNLPGLAKSPVRSSEAAVRQAGQRLEPPKIASVLPAKRTVVAEAPIPVRKGVKIEGLSGPFAVIMDANPVSFDVSPRVHFGVPIAPVRQIFENAGGRLFWNQADRTVTIIGAPKEVWMKVGLNAARLDGDSITLELPPMIINGRTLAPISFIQEALGIDCVYDPSLGAIIIGQ